MRLGSRPCDRRRDVTIQRRRRPGSLPHPEPFRAPDLDLSLHPTLAGGSHSVITLTVKRSEHLRPWRGRFGMIEQPTTHVVPRLCRIRFAPRLGFFTCPMELEPICASGDFDSKACANSPETSPETLDEQAVKETGINNTALQQTNHTNSSRGMLS